MWILIVGGISLIASLVLLICYANLKRLLDELWAVDTYSARDLRLMVTDGFEATVEVEGDVSCDSPIVSPAAGVTCCWVNTKVEREVAKTRTVTETDSDGETSTRIETYYEWETEYDHTLTAPFRLTDQSGCTLVDPEKAKIDAQSVRSEVIHYREPWFDLQIAHSDTGKYRISESVFRNEGYAFVLGKATRTGEDIIIHYPDKGYIDPKKKIFLISRKSEQQLTQSKQSSAAWCFRFAILTFLTAAFCALAYFGLIPGVVNR
jgi:hypothetical protein